MNLNLSYSISEPVNIHLHLDFSFLDVKFYIYCKESQTAWAACMTLLEGTSDTGGCFSPAT